MFKPTYLYVKTHNITGLKYFGKTIRDPYKYKGSGLDWIQHLKEFGNDVSTTIIGFYTDKTECKKVALEFSRNNNIVQSTSWANRVNETLGGDPGIKVKEILLEKYGTDYYKSISRCPASIAADAARSNTLKGNLNCASGGKKNKGKVRIKIKCTYCDAVGSKNTMYRWHFENCKRKHI